MTTPVLDGTWADVKLTGTTAGQAADAIADGRPGTWTFKNDRGEVLARTAKLAKQPGPLELVDITDRTGTDDGEAPADDSDSDT